MSAKVLFQWFLENILPVNTVIILTVCSMLTLVVITGCSSNIASQQPPREFICDFIAKKETMCDRSLLYYYVKEEQEGIAERMDTVTRLNEARGVQEILDKAKFDFSGLKIKIVDKKEEFINDEPVLFVKVAVTGNYTMMLPHESRKLDANDLIILQLARSEWKVTETKNPWS